MDRDITQYGMLHYLPSHPINKTGWPWIEESSLLLLTMPDGNPWPKISIVTPSYNQGQFLEETIRSVLLQNYPNLEYIIIDGGSTDNSVEIIKKYEPWLTYWVSEKDGGQAHAINKGFYRSSGQILNWLNSDDILLPGAFEAAASCLSGHLDKAVVVYGNRYRIDKNSAVFDFDLPPNYLNLLLFRIGSWIPQETAFFTKVAYVLAGGLSESRQFSLDYDLWLKCISRGASFIKIQAFMGSMRFHDECKSCNIADIGWIEFFDARKQILGSGFSATCNNWLCDIFLGRLLFHIKRIQKKRALKAGSINVRIQSPAI